MGKEINLLKKYPKTNRNTSERKIIKNKEIIFTAKKYGYDYGELSLLEQYEAKVKLNNLIFASSIDLVRRLFKFKNKQISNLRKNGFRQLDKFPEIKNEIIKFADKGLSF